MYTFPIDIFLGKHKDPDIRKIRKSFKEKFNQYINLKFPNYTVSLKNNNHSKDFNFGTTNYTNEKYLYFISTKPKFKFIFFDFINDKNEFYYCLENQVSSVQIEGHICVTEFFNKMGLHSKKITDISFDEENNEIYMLEQDADNSTNHHCFSHKFLEILNIKTNYYQDLKYIGSTETPTNRPLSKHDHLQEIIYDLDKNEDIFVTFLSIRLDSTTLRQHHIPHNSIVSCCEKLLIQWFKPFYNTQNTKDGSMIKEYSLIDEILLTIDISYHGIEPSEYHLFKTDSQPMIEKHLNILSVLNKKGAEQRKLSMEESFFLYKNLFVEKCDKPHN